jgi:hypothetical protein
MNRCNDSKSRALAKLAGIQWPVVVIASVMTAILGLSTGIPAGADATATTFNPGVVRLDATGVSATIAVETINLDAGADAVQINVQHPEFLEVSSPNCAGIFGDGTAIPVRTVPGGSGFGCFLIGTDVSGPTGPVMTFQITRVQDFATEQIVTLGLKDGEGTHYSDGGASIGPGANGPGTTSGLTVTPSGEPVTSIDAFPPDPDNNLSPTFTFSGFDDVTPPDALSFQCQLDAGELASCVSPHVVGPLSEGSHTFEVRATDEAGNTDATPASYSWDITGATGELSLVPHQDAFDGAAGFKTGVSRVFDSVTGDVMPVVLGSYRGQLTYDGSCVSILGFRDLDFTTTDISIDNVLGIASFGGVASAEAEAPSDFNQALVRLVGSNQESCSMTLEMLSLTDNGGNSLVVDGSKTQDMRRGDARADGAINVADTLFIAEYLAGSRPACDANNIDTNCLHPVNAASVLPGGATDQTTVADALLIVQYLAGQRDEFYDLTPQVK